MANFQTVPQPAWRTFFDAMSRVLSGKWAEIEVASLDLGDQIVAEWVPLLGITFDSRNDLLDVVLDRGSHVINHPREIIVEYAPEGLASVAVIDAEGTREVVRLREPLKLPSATGQTTVA